MNEVELRTWYTEKEADNTKGLMGAQGSATEIRPPRTYGGRPAWPGAGFLEATHRQGLI